MKLLIGSQALIKNIKLNRKPKDWDWVADYLSFKALKQSLNVKNLIPSHKGAKVTLFSKTNNQRRIDEIEIAWENTLQAELLNIIKENPHLATQEDEDTWVAGLNLLFTLKKSHRYLKDSPHFLKTMRDFKYLRDEVGCIVPDELKGWYKKRVKETYWYKHPNLDVSKKKFFKDDKVPYKYDHDTLHLAVAHLDKPAYEYYKDDVAEVKCSKEKFFSVSEKIRLYGVLEESYVLALERSQIPAPGKISPKRSFEIALMKLSSSISSGWFREYAYENYDKVLDMYSDDYMDRFKAGLENGMIALTEKNRDENGIVKEVEETA